MTTRTFQRLCLLLATVIVLPLCTHAAESDSVPGAELTRGLPKPKEAAALRPMGKTRALIIGIDYKKRDDVDKLQLPELRNAERDAADVAETLQSLYGYEPVVLLGAEATRARIGAALSKLCSQDVDPADSVLVYYSGHGSSAKYQNERGVLYPYDATFQQGVPEGECLRLHSDVVKIIEGSPASHKLLVLDSCHSGEVFNRDLPPRSEVNQDELSAEVIRQPTFQAIASCRSVQVASDGQQGANSPFSSAFIRALRRLPANDLNVVKAPIKTSRLFLSMQATLDNLHNGQSPDCRRLVADDGEFLFWPDPAADFSPYMDSVEDSALLQAMVPGEHGKWWFDETPWFIPGLRRMILDQSAANRSVGQTFAISRDNLLSLAEGAVRKADTAAADPLTKLRIRQFQRLKLHEGSSQRFREEVAKLIAELESHLPEKATSEVAGDDELTSKLPTVSDKIPLEAPDLHLLAVLRHHQAIHQVKETATTEQLPATVQAIGALVDKPVEVDKLYADAVDSYVQKNRVAQDLALQALCRCDLGKYLLDSKRRPDKAIDEFKLALQPFRCDDNLQFSLTNAQTNDADPDAAAESPTRSASQSYKQAPVAFNIYVLCCQADAYQRQNNWFEADNCLKKALRAARDFDASHSLTASVHRRQAWSLMEQWRIAEATKSFLASNDVLIRLAQESTQNTGALNAGTVAADQTPSLIEATSAESTTLSQFDQLIQFDYDAVIDYLHNLHGLAMAQRFRGEVGEAAATYRQLNALLAEALAGLDSARARSTHAISADVEARLIERQINTQQRLGDCNLFGDPELRDLKEAADDYRRALTLCDLIPVDGRAELQATLLFKQAMALGAPSETQDVERAQHLIQEAQQRLEEEHTPPTPVTKSLSELAPACVAVFAADYYHDDETGATIDGALTSLRAVLAEQCRAGGRSPHRDQLEQMLFAAKVLVDCRAPELQSGGYDGGEVQSRGRHSAKSHQGRFQAIADADQLLMLCRLALVRGSSGRHLTRLSNDAHTEPLEASRYLRPYYDSVMRCKLHYCDRQVKELLEVQWEATQGQLYVKPAVAEPTLALYVLDGNSWLLLDVPRGVSKPFSLEGHCSVGEICASCSRAEHERLALPREVIRELAALPAAGDPRRISLSEKTSLRCFWQDSVRGLNSVAVVRDPKESPATDTSKPISSTFPFRLPAEFVEAN